MKVGDLVEWEFVIMKVGDLVEWEFDEGIGIVIEVKSYAASDRVVIQWLDDDCHVVELPSNHPHVRKVS